MAATAKIVDTESKRRRAPSTTPEARESLLTSLAYDLVEERLRKGSATSAETVHFLKNGGSENRLKLEKLEKENELLVARVAQLNSMANSEELYANAIKAMRHYQGAEDEEDEDDY